MGVVASRPSRFTDHKQEFFKSQINTDSFTPEKIGTLKDKDNFATTDGKAFEFVYHHRVELLTELNHIVSLLDELKSDEYIVAAYGYYLACLLENYYKARGEYFGIESICGKNGKKQRLADFLLGNNPKPKTKLEVIKTAVQDGLTDAATTPLHMSKLRKIWSLLNFYRLSFVFSRLLVEQGVLLTQDFKLIEKLTQWLHLGTNVEKVLNILRSPTVITNPASVGVFAIRGMAHFSSVTKHWIFATGDEKQIPPLARLKHELYERRLVLINDFTWANVNLLTNYNWIFHLSGPAAAWITVGFLFFDVCMLLVDWQDKKKQYLHKKGQYANDKEFYKQQALLAETEAARKRYEALLDVTCKQETLLDIEWQATDSTMRFMVIGATCLMLGFGLSLLVQPGFAVFLCYFVCVMGAAIYLSGNAYEDYCKAYYHLDQAKLGQSDEEIEKMQKAYNHACLHFYLTLFKNIVVPSVFIAAFAICWPAALVMAAVYLGAQAGIAGVQFIRALPDDKATPANDEEVDAPLILNT